MTKQDKLRYILNQITKVKSFKGSEKYTSKAMANRCVFYREQMERLENMDFEEIKKYDFAKEVLLLAHKREKEDVIKKIEKLVYRLEIHEYSPEQNIIHFKNGQKYRVSHKRSVISALNDIPLWKLKEIVE